MSLNKIKILNIYVTSDPKQKILEEVRKRLKKVISDKLQVTSKRLKPMVIATPNPEQIVLAQTDSHFADLLNQADIAIPDGIGLVLVSRFLHRLPLIKRIPGTEFMQDLVRMAIEEGFTIGLIGGRANLAVKALECLQLRYPGLKGWAREGPELQLANPTNTTNNTNEEKHKKIQQFSILTMKSLVNENLDQYFRSIAEKIKKTQTRLVFVGLGAPKQEYFIEKLALSLRGTSVARDAAISIKKIATSRNGTRDDQNIVLMSVGGSLEFIAGTIRRAPLFIRLMGLEWCWRLIQEPWRWKRQLALLEFIWLIFKG